MVFTKVPKNGTKKQSEVKKILIKHMVVLIKNYYILHKHLIPSKI